MAETQIIERTRRPRPSSTGGNGQQLTIPNVLPILPIRNIVVFPGTVMPLNVGRQKSKSLLDEVMPGDKIIGVVTQKNADVEDPQYQRPPHRRRRLRRSSSSSSCRTATSRSSCTA